MVLKHSVHNVGLELNTIWKRSMFVTYAVIVYIIPDTLNMHY